MELQQLRYALAIADNGTFTAAAAACYVAQPSLSHAIRNLEAELGVGLFNRIGRRVTLSAAGEAFVPAAREVLRTLETLRANVDAVAGVTAGRLDLVALPSLAVDPVTPLVGAFRAAHQGVTVRLAHPDDTSDLIDLVRCGDSEVGITELPISAADLASRRLGRQELVAIFPPGSPRRGRRDLTELTQHPLVTQPAGTSTRDALDAAFSALGLSIRVAVETDQREAIVPLVLAGAGVGVVPRPMATVAQRQGAVTSPLQPALWRQLGLVHRNATLSPAARAFIDIAIEGSRADPAAVRTRPDGESAGRDR
jgi:LysR family transcriptional regulator, carnitine catabolism transcriptional activator